MSLSSSFMLPRCVCPKRYEVTLYPDLENFTFWGHETIDLNVKQTTSKIVLNTSGLEIRNVKLSKNGVIIPAKEVIFDEEKETATIVFRKPILKGFARLMLFFYGQLNNTLSGFYRSKYVTRDGAERYMATTQFEPTDARKAFPCWDEPAIKAKFEITLVVPRNLVAISNATVMKEIQIEQGKKTVQFSETPIMSTYLLAFIIGELEAISGATRDGTKVNIWAIPGREQHGKFALECSTKFLEFYNDYFGIPYPLGKLDLIAIPDFAAGAMENWGAVTYREAVLLVDEENSPVTTRQRVAVVVAHELAHQWFGNLVTMKWWNDLWLNEGFASWIEYKAVDSVFPEWDMWTQFVHMDLNSALSLDGLNNSHPIEADIKKPGDIEEQFDEISYSKGASIIRMLEEYLGEDTFREGLREYLTTYQYGNADTENLWNSLEKSSGKSVKAVMDTWTKQIGYPVLSVSRVGQTLTLSQTRFLYDAGKKEDLTLWKIPVMVTARNSTKPLMFLMETQTATKDLPTDMAIGWIRVNPSQVGYFRVKHTEEELIRLYPAIEACELEATDRLGIQDDVYAMVRARKVLATQFFSLLPVYKNEKDYTVWADIASTLSLLDDLMFGQPYYPKFQEFARDIFRTITKHIGWDAKPNEKDIDALLRSTVIGQMGRYDDEEVLREARTRFDKFLEDKKSLDSNLQGVVCALAARAGDEDTFEKLQKLAKEATLQEEKNRYDSALTCFKDPKLLRRALDYSLSECVRSQDSIFIIAGVASNSYGRELAWKFVKEHWTEFEKRYGGGGFMLIDLVSSVTQDLATQKKKEEVQRFFKEHPVPNATRTIQQSLERIGMNIKWVLHNRKSLKEWFKEL